MIKNSVKISIIFILVTGLSLACRNAPPVKIDEIRNGCLIGFPTLETADEYSKRGHNLMQGGNYDCALNDCQDSLKLDPQNIIALSCRGRISLERGALETAQTDFDSVLRLDPQNKDADYQMSILDRKKKLYDKALAEFNIATQGSRLTHSDYALRAGIYFDLQNYQQAIDDYTEAIRLKKDFQDCYLNQNYSDRKTKAILMHSMNMTTNVETNARNAVTKFPDKTANKFDTRHKNQAQQ